MSRFSPILKQQSHLWMGVLKRPADELPPFFKRSIMNMEHYRDPVLPEYEIVPKYR